MQAEHLDLKTGLFVYRINSDPATGQGNPAIALFQKRTSSDPGNIIPLLNDKYEIIDINPPRRRSGYK
jgi:hypothetical protein